MATTVDLEFGLGRKRFKDAQKGLEALAREINTAPERAAPELARQVQFYLDETRRALLRRHSKAFRNPTNVPATGEKNLLRRSGGIKNILVAVRGGKKLNQITGSLIIPFPISVHEEGATIRARRAQYLTIPLPAALDSRGIPKRRSAREWSNTFVKRSRRGNLIIFQRVGAALVPLYLLKREVKLPPRLRARETLDAGSDFFIDSTIDALAKVILGPR